MEETTVEGAPQQGRAVSGAMQVRESAPENVALKDALGQEPQRVDPFLADKTVVKEFGKNERGETITAATFCSAMSGSIHTWSRCSVRHASSVASRWSLSASNSSCDARCLRASCFC